MARNVGALASSQLATWVVAAAVTLVVPRVLGPSQMGRYSAAASPIAVMSLIAGFSTLDYLVRTMVVRWEEAPRIVGTALVLRAAAIPAFIGAIVVYSWVVGVGHSSSWIFLFVGLAAMCNLLTDPLQAGFRSMERMDYVAVSNLVSTCLAGLVAIAVVLAGEGAAGLAASAAAVAALVFIGNVWWAHRVRRLEFRPSMRDARSLAVGSLPFWPLQMVMLVYLYIDSVLLSIMQPPQVLGWYSVANRLFGTLLVVPTIVGSAWFPRLVAAFERSEEDLRGEARSYLGLIPAVSIPIAVATAVGSSAVIGTVYGKPYAGTIPVMEVMGFCCIPMYLGIALGQVLVAMKRPMAITWLLTAGIAANVGLNLVLIPLFAHRYSNGALGSAVSLLATEFLVTSGMLILFGRQILDLRSLRRIPGVVAASGGMWITGKLLAGLGLGALPVAGGVFVLLALLLGVVSRAERVYIRRSLAGLVRRGLRLVCGRPLGSEVGEART